MPNSCLVCGHVKKKGEKVSMFRFPADLKKRQQWMLSLDVTENDITEQSRVCSKHFLHGNSSNIPVKNLGRRFASPRKCNTERNSRAVKRSTRSPSFFVPTVKRRSLSLSSVTGEEQSVGESTSVTCDESMEESASVVCDEQSSMLSDSSLAAPSTRSDDSIVLAARIELLEAETQHLKSLVNNKGQNGPLHFRVEQIARNDSLIRFFTGFSSYQLFMDFFEFLGPSVYNLEYWGAEERKSSRRWKNKALTPLNQYFLVMIKLRLNLRVIDLAIRFGISKSLVSRYFTTWVCLMYRQFKEIDWTPSPEQVAATLPCAFQDKYPSTYSIIDASELFIQTPSDLFLQSSTWSSYKHHNTAKFLIGCTPNGAVSHVSELYVGSISDIELTRVSGYLQTLDGKEGVSIMADRGFTIRDLLKEKGISLNIPPFMDGKQQFSPEEIRSGRGIASLRIHVERVIGRIKNFAILKSTLPITMIRLANQIVSVCAWLTNFQPALIPLPGDYSDEEVDRYFQSLQDCDYDADSEMSGDEDSV